MGNYVVISEELLISLLRRLGFRTEQEIEKAIRGKTIPAQELWDEAFNQGKINKPYGKSPIGMNIFLTTKFNKDGE